MTFKHGISYDAIKDIMKKCIGFRIKKEIK